MANGSPYASHLRHSHPTKSPPTERVLGNGRLLPPMDPRVCRNGGSPLPPHSARGCF
ncbi:hypothetical protein I79_004992 [Cricetulus griseus]|uniref:Uncharacterized protein n=1 Tax=Cricetulus griseus TaxID=10029 RepID=G3H3Z9_CRIGR|nr:hypothetical protein I79_004992 [Cricetulus griseus]